MYINYNDIIISPQNEKSNQVLSRITWFEDRMQMLHYPKKVHIIVYTVVSFYIMMMMHYDSNGISLQALNANRLFHVREERSEKLWRC
jgi:hypothetical protein